MTATHNNNNSDDIRKLPFLFCLSLVFYARAHFACDIIKFTVEMDEQQTNIAIRAVVRVLYFVEGRNKDFTMFFFLCFIHIVQNVKFQASFASFAPANRLLFVHYKNVSAYVPDSQSKYSLSLSLSLCLCKCL